MRFRYVAVALLASMVLGAFAAEAAQAVEGEGWTIGASENQTSGGTLIPSGTHEKVTCRRHGTSSLVITTTVLGTSIELTAEAIDCLEKAGSTSGATIDNTTSKGHSEGILTFTGVKVAKPSGCAVGGATHDLTTNALTDEVIMDPTTGSTVVFDRFFPEVASAGFFNLTFEGAECPLAGISSTWKGSMCGESVHTNAGGTGYEPNKTGTMTKVQTLLFGAAQQATGNSASKPCSITFGTAAAQITGAVDTELETGKPFGVDGGGSPPATGWTTGAVPVEDQSGGGTLIASGVHESMVCRKHAGGSLAMTSTLLGSPIELTATDIDCVESKIDNTTESGHSEGKLTFTGVKVVKPGGCSVAGGEITTAAITDHVIMDPTAGSTVVFDKITPETESTFVTIMFEGAECPLGGVAAAVKGNVCGESVANNLSSADKTGTLTKVQTLTFGSSQQATGGCELKLATNAAQIVGAVDNELASHKLFGADGEGSSVGWTTAAAPVEDQSGGGSLIGSGVHESMVCRKHEGSSLAMTSSLLGSPIELTATGIDCVESKIDNTTESGHSEGKLTFTGVKVVKPGGCSVPGGEITTASITDHVIMDPTSGSAVVFDKIRPEVEPNFVTITFEGAECPLEGISAAVKGNVCGESVASNLASADLTGTLTKVQTLTFGSSQQTTGGCELKLANNAAQIVGAVDNELTSQKLFGAD